jgi:hypothetical protein
MKIVIAKEMPRAVGFGKIARAPSDPRSLASVVIKMGE